MMEGLATAIAEIVEGDLSRLPSVRIAGHRDLVDTALTLPRLVVSRSALEKVLENWRCGLFTAADIQQWASFIRRGYVSGIASKEIHPIWIEYDASSGEVIVEIIGRLGEIGDRIDGHIDAAELNEML